MPDDELLDAYLAAREQLKAAETALRAANLAPGGAGEPEPFDWIGASPEARAVEARRLGLGRLGLGPRPWDHKC